MKIAITDIDDTAFPRDRTIIDPTALEELERSLLANGLRTPIEVWHHNGTYKLIAGARRLTAFRRLHERTEHPDFAAIAVTLRHPANEAEAMAMMVEENEIRSGLSPWERGAIICRMGAVEGVETFDDAVNILYPHADRNKRRRLRVIAEVVDELNYVLVDPEALSQQRLERIGTAMRAGWLDLIIQALIESPSKDHRVQWRQIEPVLLEFEALSPKAQQRPNNPRRLIEGASRGKAVTIRREKTRAGYILHITGPGADDFRMEEIMERFEQGLVYYEQ